MPIVRFVREGEEVAVRPGTTLREAAQVAGVRLHSGLGRALNCRGHGRCGRCRVIVTATPEGLAPPGCLEFRVPRPRSERGGIERGIDPSANERLACQAKVDGDVSVWTRPEDGRPDQVTEPSPAPAAIPPRKGPIAVTGATGFVGQYLLRELAEREVPARLLLRDPAAEVEGFEAVRGDLTDADSLAALVEGASAVIHLAALSGTADGEAMEAVNLGGTRNLVDAAKEAGVPRLVLLSSSAARRPSHGPYSASKLGQEELFRRSGIPFVILQPPMIYGEGSQVQRFLGRLARLPVVPVIGGEAPLYPVHVADVANACIEAALREGVAGRSFQIGGPQEVRFVDLAQQMLAAAGSDSPAVSIPTPLAMVAAFGLEKVLSKPLLTVEGVRAATAGTPVDSRSAHEELGFAPRRLSEGLEQPGEGSDP